MLLRSIFCILSAAASWVPLCAEAGSLDSQSFRIDSVPGCSSLLAGRSGIEERAPRDPVVWPRGYYSGDELPPSTIYLTFDDGPCDFTAQLLDTLKAEGVKATFFINAYDKDHPEKANTSVNILARYAAELKRIVAEGHALGNHTYSHQDLSRLSAKQVDFQMRTLERQLAEVLGPGSPRLTLMRPPFGAPYYRYFNSEAQKRAVAAALGGRYYVCLWTNGWDSGDSVDWAKGEWYKKASVRYAPGNDKYKTKVGNEIDRILKVADGKASGVVLMHDTHPTSRDALVPLIRELKRRGYSFATMDEYVRWRWTAGAADALPAPDGAVSFSGRADRPE